MEELVRAVREVLVASDHVRRTTAAAAGVGVNHFAFLCHLLHDGPQTPSVIAERVGLTPTSTTAVIDRMERVQLVRRSPHPSDRRRTLVSLTPLGRDAVAALYTTFSRDIGRALDRADPRLRADDDLREAVTAILTGVAAALWERAGDRLGVEAALAVTHPVTLPIAGDPAPTTGAEGPEPPGAPPSP